MKNVDEGGGRFGYLPGEPQEGETSHTAKLVAGKRTSGPPRRPKELIAYIAFGADKDAAIAAIEANFPTATKLLLYESRLVADPQRALVFDADAALATAEGTRR